MAPHEIRRQAVSDLRAIILALMSPEWDQALEAGSEEQVAAAGRSLLQAQRVRLRLGTAELSRIRDDLMANEEALADGRATLEEALGRLDRVRGVLGAVTGFLGVVARIIPLPG